MVFAVTGSDGDAGCSLGLTTATWSGAVTGGRVIGAGSGTDVGVGAGVVATGTGVVATGIGVVGTGAGVVGDGAGVGVVVGEGSGAGGSEGAGIGG